MLPTTITSVFELFRKVLGMMIENGILKSFTFLYVESTQFLIQEKFLVNTVNILNEIKKLLLRLYLEFSEWHKDNIELEEPFCLLVSNNARDINEDIAFSRTSDQQNDNYGLLDTSNNDRIQTGPVPNDLFASCDNKITSSFVAQFAEAVSFFESADCWNSDINLSANIQNSVSVLETPTFEQLTCGSKFETETISVCKPPIISENVDILSCDHCGEFFTSKRRLSIHIIRIHKRLEIGVSNAHNEYKVDDLSKTTFLETYSESEVLLTTRENSVLKNNVTSLIDCSNLSFSSPQDSNFDLKTPELNTESCLKFDVSDTLPLPHETQNACEQFFENVNSLSMTCDHCGQFFSSKRLLTIHIISYHKEHKRNTCPECGKSFTRKLALEMHMDIHLGIKRYECPVCWKMFSQKVTCDAHIQAHTGFYKYRCKECDRGFPTRAKLNFHVKCHEMPLYQCSICDKKFATIQYLSYHQKSHQTVCQINCFKCEMTFRSKHRLMNHLKTAHSGTRIPCSIIDCSDSFNSYASLRQHIRWKHSAKKVKCELCGLELSRQGCLRRHMQKLHADNTNTVKSNTFHCAICNSTYSTKTSYNVHMDTHMQSQKHSCNLCGKMFRRKDVLKQHMNLHSGYRGHICQICGRGFALKSNLTVHVAKHNQIEDQKSIQCDKCGKKFKTNSSLRFHTKMHEGQFRFKCDVCDKQFVRKCHYDVHLLTHSTDRPFKCVLCPSSFKINKHLRDHLKCVHKNVQNFTSFLDSFPADNRNVHNENSQEYNFIPSISHDMELNI